MTVIDELVQFGLTGAVGPVRCGALLGEIAADLGAPLDLGRVGKQRRWPHRFGYGDLELCACRCRRVLSLTVQTWREAIELPRTGLGPGQWFVRYRERVGQSELMAALRAAGCAVEEDARPVPGQVTLRALGSGVAFVFGTDHRERALLECADVWGAGHDCPPVEPGMPEDGFGLGEGWGPAPGLRSAT
ncbi:hypothetical protein KDL01_35385 [Actinospica durhamensis]|uniref:Uncharacterized protein n=1 Tax=Actinospica durhamensis TaxID=1508375 RepID=A0A941IRA9_9ACTN|nr:hypothetical protein [Actinospica durhamensis]MBR7838605.1 hypothetical protein [Actinospica durhamensis]